MKAKAIVTLGLFGALTALVAGQAALTQPQSGWPRDNPPRPLPARPVTFPSYEIRKLANGMQVVLVSQNEQPVVSVRMIVRAGAAHDPKGKQGLAMMTATLLDQGAGTRNAARARMPTAALRIDFPA